MVKNNNCIDSFTKFGIASFLLDYKLDGPKVISEDDISITDTKSKELRKEIRKQLKASLSETDKLKFTRFYELVFGKSFRNDFEKNVTKICKQYISQKKSEDEEANKILADVKQKIFNEKYLDVLHKRLDNLRR